MKKNLYFIFLVTITFMAFLIVSNNFDIEKKYKQKNEESIILKSAYKEEDTYKEYLKLKEEGQIGENGFINNEWIEELTENIINEEYTTTFGTVSLTFAKNSLLNVNYFIDKNFTQKINSDQGIIMVDSGDIIYASLPEVKKESFINNVFSGFMFMADGEYIKNVEVNYTDNYISFVIPKNIDNLLVIPKSELRKVNITFNDSYLNENYDLIKLNGEWIIDDITYSRSKSASQLPANEYIVKYKYDNNLYYVDKNINNDIAYDLNGEAMFKPKEIIEDYEYKIELSKYKTLNIEGEFKKGLDKISKNYKEIDKQQSIEKLKNDDSISITLNKGYVLLENNKEIPGIEIDGEKTIYTYNIPMDYNLEYTLKISEEKKVSNFKLLNIENAKVEAFYKGTNKTVLDDDILESNDEITLRITPDSGYYIEGKNIKDGIYQKDYKYKKYLSEFEKALNNIQIKKYITITFDTRDDKGTVTYLLGKQEVEGKITKIKEGQTIKIAYTYEIAEENKEESKSFIQYAKDLISSKQKTITKTFKATEDLNNTTITRSAYISVEEED